MPYLLIRCLVIVLIFFYILISAFLNIMLTSEYFLRIKRFVLINLRSTIILLS